MRLVQRDRTRISSKTRFLFTKSPLSIHLWTSLIVENARENNEQERGNVTSGTRFKLERKQILFKRHVLQIIRKTRYLSHIKVPFTRRLWQEDDEADAIGQEKSLLAAAADPFDTPMFNRLIRLMEEQNATSQAQREALEKQNMMLQAQSQVLEEQREVMKDTRHIQLKETVDATMDIRSNEHAVQTISAQPNQEPSRPVLVARNLSQDPHQQLPSPNPLTFSITDAVPIPITESKDSNNEKVDDQVAEEPSESTATEVVINKRVEDATDSAPSHSQSSKGHVHDAIMILNETMKGVKETLLDHGTKLNVLIKDALKDDQPYDLKPMEDESTCTALYEMAMASTKEQVDEWIKRMDVSLVFVSNSSIENEKQIYDVAPSDRIIFSGPHGIPYPGYTESIPVVEQLRIGLSSPASRHFTAESLILAILDAVLCVIGRQWMSKLTTRPEGATYRERLLRHLGRERLAKRWLQYLVEGLHVILLGSIGLFMTGLLYQLRNLAGSFDENAPRLLNTWKVCMSLSSIILAVVAAATINGLFYEVSPFGGTFSNLLVKIAETFWSLFVLVIEWFQNGKWTKWLEAHVTISWMSWADILYVLLLLTTLPISVPCFAILWLRVEFDREDKNKLMAAFMDLIAEASDPKLLERAVGSFSYVEWIKSGEQSRESVDQLKKTWNRLTATDTSVRVHETLKARISAFVEFCAKKHWEINDDIMSSIVQSSPYSTRFRAEVLSTSFGDNNSDLRPLAALPFEECIARVLCSRNHDGIWGNRTSIFVDAQRYCVELLFDEATKDDLTRILSHVDRLDFVKSHILTHGTLPDPLVEFVVKDHKHEVLRGLDEFIRSVEVCRFGPSPFSQIFIILVSPPPTDIDLSPLIGTLSEHTWRGTWRETSNTVIAYLTSFNFAQISDYNAVRRFLRLCLDSEARDAYGSALWEWIDEEDKMQIRREAQTLLDTALDGRTNTTLLPTEDHGPASDSNTRYFRDLSVSNRRAPPPEPHSARPSVVSIPLALSSDHDEEASTQPEPLTKSDPELASMTYPPFSLQAAPDSSIASTSNAVFHASPALKNAHE
ncbi:hypothetical protein SISNIDRAFT_528169 [Sistotremastrum niveocremeum HHB9708]|uniref:DUF6535 domain-containing protein n=1 Tax=Sistotremastrum niveocremeum HHB9708 TaxID=1314777 RepID=A0A164PQE5_9AGAM|nr:hypothetical protein SISNIDRAFT_528169 [Sistotremastrum niveocremeum HHB9708]